MRDKFQAALDKIVKHSADGGMHRMVKACGVSEISFLVLAYILNLCTMHNSSHGTRLLRSELNSHFRRHNVSIEHLSGLLDSGCLMRCSTNPNSMLCRALITAFLLFLILRNLFLIFAVFAPRTAL
jgi:hypothetical protein